jgi:hypothetical protein
MTNEIKAPTTRPEKTADSRPALRVKTNLRAGDGSSFHKDPPPPVECGPWLNNHSVVLAKRHARG